MSTPQHIRPHPAGARALPQTRVPAPLATARRHFTAGSQPRANGLPCHRSIVIAMNTSTAFPATRFRSARSLVLAGLLGAALLTGCGGGGGGDDDGVASIEGAGSDTPASAEASDKDAEQQMLDYAECLRGQGLDVPDPEFDEDGGARITRRADGDGGQRVTPEDFDKAREVCGDPPAPPGGGGGRPDQAEFQDAALAFAKCMREQGIDMPDPQFSGENGAFIIGQEGNGFNPDDPKMKAAEEKCQPIMDALRPGDDDE